MSIPLDTLLEQALALPADERARLAEQLLESLRDAGFENESIEAEWKAEIARRRAELEAGTVKLKSWDELRSELVASERTSGG